jgi:hypothetical protein
LIPTRLSALICGVISTSMRLRVVGVAVPVLGAAPSSVDLHGARDLG